MGRDRRVVVDANVGGLVAREQGWDGVADHSLRDLLAVEQKCSLATFTGSLAAGVIETAIGAIYIDGGYEKAHSFIRRVFGSLIDKADAEQAQGNYKSLLQQHAQEKFNATPVYILLDEKGPDHNKCFELEVVVDNHHFTSAWGTNKKEAEQKAAFNALVELEVLEKTSEDEEE